MIKKFLNLLNLKLKKMKMTTKEMYLKKSQTLLTISSLLTKINKLKKMNLIRSSTICPLPLQVSSHKNQKSSRYLKLSQSAIACPQLIFLSFSHLPIKMSLIPMKMNLPTKNYLMKFLSKNRLKIRRTWN